MGEWRFECWSCRQLTQMDAGVLRQQACPHCHSDMHACKNCHHYSPGSHNACTETLADYVSDKERANFCGMYRPFSAKRQAQVDVAQAKARLEALFAKKI